MTANEPRSVSFTSVTIPSRIVAINVKPHTFAGSPHSILQLNVRHSSAVGTGVQGTCGTVTNSFPLAKNEERLTTTPGRAPGAGGPGESGCVISGDLNERDGGHWERAIDHEIGPSTNRLRVHS